jgi:rhodanese-related sulfurtransferase
MKFLTNLFIFSLFVILSACGQNGYKNVNTSEFQEMLQNSDAILIDFRTPEEFSSGRISEAKNINYYDADIAKQIAGLDPQKTYLVYCKSGGRSAKAASMMAEAGIKNVFNLDGGIIGWERMKLPLNK